MNNFQFDGTTLLKWTDRFGTSHPLDSLGNGQCNLKAPTLFTDEGKITEKSLLPIKSWSYGPRQFEYEKIAITIGSLQCEQNNTGCGSHFWNPAPFNILKKPLLVLKQMIHQQKALDLNFNLTP